MNDLPEPAPRRLPGSAPTPDVLQGVVTEGRRRRRKAWLAAGGAGCAVLLAVALTGTLTGAAGHDALTVQPADTPTPQVTVTDATPTPTTTTQPSGSSQPSASSLPTTAPAGPDVTLSLVGQPVNGQQGGLRVHVATADTWTAYVLSFNAVNGSALELPRIFWYGNVPNAGDVDRAQLFDVCKAQADLTRPTDETRTFPFTPLAAGRFHAIIQVLHGSCSTGPIQAPMGEFTLAGPHVVTTTLDFTVEDSGWHFDANGPKQPHGTISFERQHYSNDPPLTPDAAAATPGFQFSAGDPDGALSAVTVDWGDGSAPEDIDHASVPGCRGGGVSGSMTYWSSDCIYQPDHTYADAGHYLITLTVQSGAGTRNPQTTSVTAEWVDSGPSPTPTPTPS
jgi:hypothetical protein